MRAAVARRIPTANMDIASVAHPIIDDPGDVILKIEACGICGTDLHILAGESYRPDLPFTLGHEPVGTVVAAGADARALLGRRVTVTLFTGCGHCAVCDAGDERVCPDLRSIYGVLGAPGGFAEYLGVHARHTIELPSTLGSIEAAVLVDGGATAANAVRVALAREPRRVLVVGAGPIGFLVTEMLRVAGIPVDIVQRSQLRLEALAAIGHKVHASFDELEGAYDVVIDCAGSPAPVMPGIEALGPRGEYILAGYALVPQLDLAKVARKEASIRGIRSGRREDLERSIELVATGKVRLPDIETWPLEEINEAIAALRRHEVGGKAVIVPRPRT